jgi:hypothetical protein
VRAVVLLQAHDLLHLEVTLEVGHVADVRAAERVDRLVVVAHREDERLAASRRPDMSGHQLQPPVLQPVGVLEFVDQDVPEALRVVLSEDLVSRQQLIAPQKKLGEIDDALALALLLVGRVERRVALGRLVADADLARPDALFLLAVDEVHELARREPVLVGIGGLQHALDGGQLVLRVKDGEGLRQACLAVVHAQHPVGKAVERADPHPARVNRQHRGNAGEHLARGLVGERHREDVGRCGACAFDKPGNARREHARLAATRAGENERMLVGRRDRG